jgi:hypothetical protein
MVEKKEEDFKKETPKIKFEVPMTDYHAQMLASRYFFT